MALLARAVDGLPAAADADLLPTPGADSLLIALTLEWPIVDHTGQAKAIEARPLIPAFTIAHPWVEPVEPLHVVEPTYPRGGRVRNVEGTVILDFVVDTAGRADPATIHDVWPAERPRLTGDAGEWYRDFLNAVRFSARRSEYRPARIGGCPVRQRVNQPFSFRLNG